MTTITTERTDKETDQRGVLGSNASRPDGAAKVSGQFAFSSDLSVENMLWGATLRSPHPYARIVNIDLAAAWQILGVEAIVTAEDVPGKQTFGLISSDQPVFASDVVRYMGE
ncbi:MAG: xanthine dehydrogenase subunit D, partial [Ilumatobacteraceae bacterium]